MTLERVEKGYTWRMMKATNWYVTCEIYRKIWVIRKLMNQREAWYAPWNICDPWMRDLQEVTFAHALLSATWRAFCITNYWKKASVTCLDVILRLRNSVKFIFRWICCTLKTFLELIFDMKTEFSTWIFHLGTLWMNWCMVGICAGCIPLLLLFKEKYSRLELDAANRKAKRTGAIQNTRQDEETPLISSVEIGYGGGEKNGVHNRNGSTTSEV